MSSPEANVPSTTEPVEARVLPQLRYVFVALVGLLVLGIAASDEVISSTGLRTAWIVVCSVSVLVLGVPTFRGRLSLSPDGILTKRVVRTSRVDLRDLATIHTRGDHPWNTNPQGVLRFVDHRGGRVEVPVVPGAWVPAGPLWRALANVVETSGQPMSGIVGAQIERYLERSLKVGEANRRALGEARELVRAGRAQPHRSHGGGGSQPVFLVISAALAGIAFAIAPAMAPPGHLGLTRAITAALAASLLLSLVVTRRGVLAVTSDAEVVLRRPGRQRTVDLSRLAAVELRPDAPYLQRTVQGIRPNGRRCPRVLLRDDAGRSLTIHLDGRWREPVPVLRQILAAADVRGLDLSPNARYELEFYLGLTDDLRWPADDVPRSGAV